MHIGHQVTIFRDHLQGQVSSETIAAQAPSEAVHHCCADCQLVLGAITLPCITAASCSARCAIATVSNAALDMLLGKHFSDTANLLSDRSVN